MNAPACVAQVDFTRACDSACGGSAAHEPAPSSGAACCGVSPRGAGIYLGLRAQWVAHNALVCDYMSEAGLQCVTRGVPMVHEGHFL